MTKKPFQEAISYDHAQPLFNDDAIHNTVSCMFMDGARVYFHTDDIDATLQVVIGELGSVAEFIDTEGNRIALHSPKKE